MNPIGFDLQSLSVPLAEILPLRQLLSHITVSKKYAQIRASIMKVELIEPLSIAPRTTGSKHYFLLDGHVHLSILKELGKSEDACLVAKDDEGYTYNGEVNRVSSIQEHIMTW